jgi:hypothetical protein
MPSEVVVRIWRIGKVDEPAAWAGHRSGQSDVRQGVEIADTLLISEHTKEEELEQRCDIWAYVRRRFKSVVGRSGDVIGYFKYHSMGQDDVTRST